MTFFILIQQYNTNKIKKYIGLLTSVGTVYDQGCVHMFVCTRARIGCIMHIQSTLRTEAPAYDQISCRRASIGEGQFQSKYMETDETGRSTLTLFYSSYIRPTECYLNTYNTKVNIYLALSCVAYISGLDVYVSAVGAVFLRLMYRPAVSVCMTHWPLFMSICSDPLCPASHLPLVHSSPIQL